MDTVDLWKTVKEKAQNIQKERGAHVHVRSGENPVTVTAVHNEAKMKEFMEYLLETHETQMLKHNQCISSNVAVTRCQFIQQCTRGKINTSH